MPDVKITYSNGYGKGGNRFAFVRPAKDCMNRSWRVPADRVQQCIAKHFPTEIKCYLINGWVIGSVDESNALKEYWRVCERNLIGVPFDVSPIELQEQERSVANVDSSRHNPMAQKGASHHKGGKE